MLTAYGQITSSVSPVRVREARKKLGLTGPGNDDLGAG